MVTSSAPRRLLCTAMSMAVLPPPITTIRRPIGSVRFVRGLAQPRDIGDGVLDARPCPRLRPPAHSRRPARCRGTRHRSRCAAAESVTSRPSALPVLAPRCRRATGRSSTSRWAKSSRHLVGGDAVFVQPAELLLRLEDRDLMAEHGQAMGAGEPGRPAADHRHALARRRRRAKGCDARCEQMIGGIALQRADIHRLVLAGLRTQALLAQHLGRADPRAGAAEDVLLEDGDRRALHVAGRDLADEAGDVDAGRAGLDAGRVVAEVAAAGIDQRLACGRAAPRRRRNWRR